jgi:phospholipase D1/2
VRIFEELPQAEIVSVSPPDVSDITPMLLSYTIHFHYKEVLQLPSSIALSLSLVHYFANYHA